MLNVRSARVQRPSSRESVSVGMTRLPGNSSSGRLLSPLPGSPRAACRRDRSPTRRTGMGNNLLGVRYNGEYSMLRPVAG
jgi:hypothetical protein